MSCNDAEPPAQPQLIFHYSLVSLLASEVISIVVGNVRALLVVFKFNEFQQHQSADSFFYSQAGRIALYNTG